MTCSQGSQTGLEEGLAGPEWEGRGKEGQKGWSGWGLALGCRLSFTYACVPVFIQQMVVNKIK